MDRVKENLEILLKIQEQVENCTITIEEVEASILADISKSLAVIADKLGEVEK